MLDTCRRCALVNTLLGLVALVPGLLTKALGRRDGSRGDGSPGIIKPPVAAPALFLLPGACGK